MSEMSDGLKKKRDELIDKRCGGRGFPSDEQICAVYIGVGWNACYKEMQNHCDLKCCKCGIEIKIVATGNEGYFPIEIADCFVCDGTLSDE